MSTTELLRLLEEARAKTAAVELELLGARQVIAARRERDAAEVTA